MATGIVNPHAVAAGAFSPEQFPFNHLYWAGGPNMLAEGYANNDSIPVWPCEITGNSVDDLVPEAGYASSNFLYGATSINGNEAVYFANALHQGLRLDARWSDYTAMNTAAAVAGSAQATLICMKYHASAPDNVGLFTTTNHVNRGQGSSEPNIYTYKTASPSKFTSVFRVGSSNTQAVSSTASGTHLLPHSFFYDAKSSDPVGATRSGDMFWLDGVAGTSSGTMSGWNLTPWGYWGVGGMENGTTSNLKFAYISFVGVYQHPTILMRDQPEFDDLNTWFNSEYGMDIIT